MKRGYRALAAATAVLMLLAMGCSEEDPPTQVGAEPSEPADGDESAASEDTLADEAAASEDTMADESMDTGDDHDDSAESDSDHDESTDSDHDHDESMDSGEDHASDLDDHASHEVSGTTPTVSVEAVPDPSGGVDVRVTTTDFTVAPHSASTEHVDGEGHFRLYVDGEKWLRFYNESIHVEGIPEGEVTIEVELSGNDHGAYSIGGVPIRGAFTLTVPPHEHSGHDHGEPEPLEWIGEAPTLEIAVHDDPDSGWNVFLELDGFELSGEHASGEHVEGEGHIHLYVDDLKVMRLYGLAAHLTALPPGEHEIRVGLYANDHRPYVLDGEPIEATTTMTVES
jgi:hypothetical protein